MVRSLPRARLAIAVLLAVLAGFIDGIAFIYLGGYFVSFMSGNTTQSGVELAGGDPAAVAFVVGVMAGTAIRSPRRDRGWVVLLGVAAIVAVGATLASAAPVDPDTVTGAALLAVAPTAVCLSFAMGAVNTVFSGDGGTSFGITYMTGALVKIGEGVVGALRGGDRTGWLRYLALWLAIAVGAIGGAVGYAAIGTAALWFAAVFALGIVWVDLTARARASRGSAPA